LEGEHNITKVIKEIYLRKRREASKNDEKGLTSLDKKKSGNPQTGYAVQGSQSLKVCIFKYVLIII